VCVCVVYIRVFFSSGGRVPEALFTQVTEI